MHAGTLRPIPTEPLCIPDLCLAGRLPQQHNAVFNLDLSAANAVPGAAADVTAWPEFHNGVAAGIRLAPGGGGLTRTWVVYNKPKTPNYTHAGMLMGLGLAGTSSLQYLLHKMEQEGGRWGGGRRGMGGEKACQMPLETASIFAMVALPRGFALTLTLPAKTCEPTCLFSDIPYAQLN